jgi:integrase
VLHRALKYAVKVELIDVNPADRVDRPKVTKFIGSFYDSDEVQKLFEAVKGTKLEIPIFLGAFYGLRRSEAIGLK